MAQFPDIPLGITCEIAPGADLTTDPTTWPWTTLTCAHPSNPAQTISRVTNDAITIRKKALIGGVNTSGETSSATIKLLNHDGALTPGNPTSPYWPNLDEGVPARISITDRDTTPVFADTFTRTVSPGWGTSTSGHAWTISNSAASSVTGSVAQTSLSAVNSIRTATTPVTVRDCEVVYDASWPQVATGGDLIVAAVVRRLDSTTFLRAGTHFGVSGTVRAVLASRVGGVETTLSIQTVPSLTYTAGQLLRTRIRVQDQRLQMRVWPAAGTEPTVWHLDYTTVPLTSPGVFGLQTLVGATTTNPLPIVLSVDNVTVTALPSTRAHMYITDIQPTFEPLSGGSTWSTVQVSLGGVGAILEKRSAVSQSPMRRSVQQAPIPPYAYWPLEDAQGSTSAASAFPDGPRMIVSGPAVFGFDAGTPADEYLTRYGTKPLVSLAAGAKLTAIVPTAPVQTEWAVSFISQCWAPGIPLAELRIAQWETPGGAYDRWALVATTDGYIVRGYTRASGVSVYSELVTSPAGTFAGQVTWTVEAQQSGPNINVELFVNDFSLGSLLFFGALTPLTRITLNPDAVNTTASTSPYGIKLIYGHVRVVQETNTHDTPYYTPAETGKLIKATEAWAVEPAHRRALRLCEEERVRLTVDGTPDLAGSTLLGAQRDGTFQPLLKDAVDAESGGLLHEEWHGYRLLPRTARYNRPVALTVDLATYGRSDDTSQGDVLVPQLASRAANYWTIRRSGGSEGTYAADAEVRKRRGTVADERTLDLVSDDVLTDHARWRTHVNTDDRTTNYPTLPVDLAANPGLVEAFKTLLIGDRVVRVNAPTIAGFDPIDQVVEGITETISPTSWRAELDAAPASVWDIGVYDGSTTRRDSASTTLGVARTSGDTSWTFTTANKADVWDTTAVPYDVSCGGETVTVTAMGAASGSGPWTQTATVTRAVNGVVKAQTVGSKISLAVPAYRGL